MVSVLSNLGNAVVGGLEVELTFPWEVIETWELLEGFKQCMGTPEGTPFALAHSRHLTQYGRAGTNYQYLVYLPYVWCLEISSHQVSFSSLTAPNYLVRKWLENQTTGLGCQLHVVDSACWNSLIWIMFDFNRSVLFCIISESRSKWQAGSPAKKETWVAWQRSSILVLGDSLLGTIHGWAVRANHAESARYTVIPQGFQQVPHTQLDWISVSHHQGVDTNQATESNGR